MKILRILIIDEASDALLKKLNDAGFEPVYAPAMEYDEVLSVIHEMDGVILRSKIKAGKEFIDAGTKLKFIGRIGAGMETIDIPYAESKGIACINSPEGNMDAVGEHATGMLLSLANNLNRADREVRNKIWRREENRGFELKGKNIGIIGYGHMGSSFAKKLSGFEVNVISYDKYKTAYSDAYTKEVSLEELQEKADVISLHVPQTDETIGMINAEFIENCKKPFILINTARGKVVDTDAVAAAMKTGKIKAAALDVLEYESYNFQDFFTDDMPEAFSRLVNSDNVILTPHIAGWTVESKFKLADVLADKIIVGFGG